MRRSYATNLIDEKLGRAQRVLACALSGASADLGGRARSMEESMSQQNRVSWVVSIVAMLVAMPLALAQSRTTGAIKGTVTESGNPLPGATVEISSPSMIGGKRVTTTDTNGRYRFAEIPPGEYTITVIAMEQENTVLSGVKVALGKTIDVPVGLTGSAGSEELDVEGSLPQIDVTSAATTTTYPKEVLHELPLPRFQPDAINFSPGVNFDSAFGGGTAGNAYQIDGVDTSDPEGGTPWSFVNYNIIDEVQYVGLGAPAEYGGFTGVVFNSSTKSGGNSLSGSSELYFVDQSFVGENVPRGVDITVPTIEKSWDLSFQIGGPIRQDKLWYFASLQSYGFDSSSGGPLREERSPRGFGKLTYQVDASNKLEGWVEYDEYNIKGRGGDAETLLEATVREDAPEWIWNFSWQRTISANTIFNAMLQGYTGYYYLNPERGYDIPGRYNADLDNDGDGDAFYSDNSYYFYLADRDRNNINSSITHHTTNFLKGEHDFKFGMEIERSVVRSRYGYTTGKWFYDNYYTGDDPGDVGDEYVPYSVAYYGNGYDVHGTNKRVSLYAQDSWQITPSFALNPGLRLDLMRGDVPGSQNVYENEVLAPRIGFAWNLGARGKSLIKGHLGRYYEKLVANYFYYVDEGAFESSFSNIVWPSGTVESFTDPVSKRYLLDPNLKHPYVDQITVGWDQELPGAFTLGITAVYREGGDFIETVGRRSDFQAVRGFIPNNERLDPGDQPDYDANLPVGPPPFGEAITLFDYIGDGEQTLDLTNPSNLYRKYKGVIITANRRLRDNWLLNASYVYARVRGNYDNTTGISYGPSSFLDTPNSLINADGRLTHDQEHEIKLLGSYLLPNIGLQFSVYYAYFSGDTWTRRSRCLYVDDGSGLFTCDRVNSPTGTRIRYFAEERGSRRLPGNNKLDFRVAWKKPVKDNTFELFVDCFNLLNRGYATDIEDDDGDDFSAPLEWNLPRYYQIGARYSW
jgi:hypothetical protein